MDNLDATAEQVMVRYAGAYKVAGYLSTVGQVLKIMGIVVPAFIVIATLVAEAGAGITGVTTAGGLLSAFLCFLFFFIAGIMISAQGQMMKATVDVAINTSPFLTNEQRARGMAL